MVASRKRARSGDIIEVRTPRGLAYVQHAGKHPKYGDAIRVLPGFFQARPSDWSTLLAEEGYFTFYPVGAAVSQGVVEIAAHQLIPPGRELPAVYRRAGWTTPEGKVTTWFICEGARQTRRTELSADERRLFIADIWNHEFLVDRLVQEWRPEQEPSENSFGDSAPVRRETPPTAENAVPGGRLSHYLYFPERETGEAVAAELRRRGFDVRSRMGADEVNWLVLASHVLESPEQLPAVRSELEHLAERHAGEYDGWELAADA